MNNVISESKDETALVVRDCYNEEEFDMGDVVKNLKEQLNKTNYLIM